jgi:hypothetical protein
MDDRPAWSELLRIEHAIDQNGAREMMHRFDVNPAADQCEIAMSRQQRLHHLLDLRCRRHRRGLVLSRDWLELRVA